jgi:hypothetical protein
MTCAPCERIVTQHIEQRLKLQQELEQLTPIPDDDLKRVADLLEHFATRWKRTRKDPEAQRELVKLIVERVYMDGEAVVAMTLRSNYHLVLGHNINGPTDFTVDPFLYTDGSDGGRVSMWNTGQAWSTIDQVKRDGALRHRPSPDEGRQRWSATPGCRARHMDRGLSFGNSGSRLCQ